MGNFNFEEKDREYMDEKRKIVQEEKQNKKDRDKTKTSYVKNVERAKKRQDRHNKSDIKKGLEEWLRG